MGSVLRSFGTKGFFKVKSFSGETKHFLKFKKVYLLNNKRYETFHIEKIQNAHRVLLLKVRGINSPEAVKKYIKCEIWVNKKYACSLQRGEYYVSDLCQCNIFLKGKMVGNVKSVFESAHADLLEVIYENDKIMIIPFLDHFVGVVDIRNKRINLREDCVLL